MLTIEYVKNPQFITEDGLAINLIVKFAEFDEELPFTAMSTDSETHGRDLFERAKLGEFGIPKAYAAPL